MAASKARCDIEPAPTLSARVPPELLLGLAREDGRFLHLLDLQRALEEDARLPLHAPAPAPAAAAGT